jgi:DNA-binding transcriptional LysR family regulator
VLGGKLVNRTASSVTLTELGAAILPHAQRVLSVAQLAFHDMEQIVEAGGDGTVRIGLVPSVSSLLFPLLPQVLAQTFPGCGSSFTIRPTMRWCVSCKAGRLISVSAPSTARYPPRCRSIRCAKIRLWRCCTVTIRWPPAASAVETARRARYCGVLEGQYSAAGGALAESHRLTLNTRFQVDYIETLYGLVRSRLAIAILPELYTTHLQDPALKIAQLQQPALARTVALMRGPQPLPPLIEQCFTLLLNSLRESSARLRADA